MILRTTLPAGEIDGAPRAWELPTPEREPERPLHITSAEIEAHMERAGLSYRLAMGAGRVGEGREIGRFLLRMEHHLHRARYAERKAASGA